ncbi:hypothetical protein Cni_G08940 [Canna indica]|uniref:Histone acetyltransferase n=1 Tax=Canna indica TaxID=4628 RepID=A0AAQ3K4V0_9LILI|nr:hypothetical protein Cni_G08940 [Canna indica]
MPRPGPRPYECVRRAWHSDRHRPIRGSIIQEIFRVANDVHSPATRKNKEFQEKLPFVVLKAEEIMYSKANSEAEYVDLKTLQDRVNDAIDTIIRKEEATESGDLLQPCIEAALNLGCIPRRVSKSQHRSNPSCYLSPISNDVRTASLKISDNNKANLEYMLRTTPNHGNLQNSASEFPSWYTALFKPTNTTCSSTIPEIKFNNSDVSRGHINSSIINRSLCPISVRPSPTLCQERGSIPPANYTSSNLAGVYPLYYNSNAPEVHSCQSFQINPGPGHHIATEILRVESLDEGDISYTESPIGSKSTMGAPKGDPIFMETSKTEWDLSLRLGLPSPPSFESTWTNDCEDRSSNSSDGSKHYASSARERAKKAKTMEF